MRYSNNKREEAAGQDRRLPLWCVPMIDPKHLDDLAQRLADSVPSGLRLLQDDLKRNLRITLETGLARLDLVTREEFDVQTAVLARTREKLETLQGQITELEQRVKDRKKK